MTGDTDLLLAVDVQNDFCPGGALAVPRGDEVLAPINRIGRRFAHVALTQDWHPRDHRSFRLAARRKATLRDDRAALWRADAVARALHPGHFRRCLPALARPPACG